MTGADLTAREIDAIYERASRAGAPLGAADSSAVALRLRDGVQLKPHQLRAVAWMLGREVRAVATPPVTSVSELALRVAHDSEEPHF